MSEQQTTHEHPENPAATVVSVFPSRSGQNCRYLTGTGLRRLAPEAREIAVSLL